MKNIRFGTFNLFQFTEPPYSWYEKKSTFSEEKWRKKTSWIKEQINDMNCDIIGFQEVFSANALQTLCKEMGFNYFVTVDKPQIDNDDSHIFVSTTVALASKHPILEVQKVNINKESFLEHNYIDDFNFSRTPIKALIQLPNQQNITVYVNHLKSNRLNELEYVFNKQHTLEEKINKTKEALNSNISKALKQRLCEASSLFFDFKNTSTPIVFLCDLNDKLFSLTIEALTNESYHDKNQKNAYILYDTYNLDNKVIYNPHPEQKEIKRIPTSYFQGVGNVLDYIFVSKDFNENMSDNIGKIISHKVLNTHLHNNPHGSILQSDHAQVVCEIKFY